MSFLVILIVVAVVQFVLFPMCARAWRRCCPGHKMGVWWELAISFVLYALAYLMVWACGWLQFN